MSRKDKERIFTYVELDGKVPVQKLSLADQIRVLFKQLTYDESKELKRDDIFTKEILRLRADLINFIYTATEPIRRGEKQRVRLSISSKFEAVFDEVVESPRIKEYYDVIVKRPDIEYDIPYLNELRLEVK